ncbi:MAG: HAD hydrolase-like protein [Myxococcales bacterium]|jgi:phosphoglycolate phosphatase|nr:HAD hydrolase-like protein [Myxococcales bacterium]
MQPTVLLFDIDGTLISSGGVARRCIQQAFAERYGRSDTLAASFGGMTDRAIVREALGPLRPDLQGAALEMEIDAALDAYLAVLEAEAGAATSSFRVHRGIHAALDAVVGRADYAVGLGTGNVRRGARIKLECVGLFDAFTFGGFGCDHIERPRLLHIGAERGAAELGVPLAACRVVVIGDTPKDVAAAHAIGAECVAVATGAASRAELLAHRPEALFDDLAEPGAIEAIIGS